MNMNPMQYDVNDAYRQEMEQKAAKRRMVNEVMRQRQPGSVMRSVVERVVQAVATMREQKPQEAIPAFDPNATANGIAIR